METVGINPENIAPSRASMHQVPAVAPTYPYWARIDDEGRCERTARLPVSRSSSNPKRLLWGPCTPMEEPHVSLRVERITVRCSKGSTTPDAIGGCTVPCISNAHEPCEAPSREESFRRFR